jgi:hypothetical protein
VPQAFVMTVLQLVVPRGLLGVFDGVFFVTAVIRLGIAAYLPFGLRDPERQRSLS